MKPRSTDRGFAVLAALSLAALSLAACASSGSVVEAATIPSDVAAAQAKPGGAGRSPARAKASGDLPWRAGQRLRGTYTCTQGKTRVVVDILEVSGDDFEATADFTFSGGRSAPARGKWRIRGTFDAEKRGVRFEADSWIDEAEGYALVDFLGNAAADGSVTGTVAGKGCTTFSLAVDKSSERSVP